MSHRLSILSLLLLGLWACSGDENAGRAAGEGAGAPGEAAGGSAPAAPSEPSIGPISSSGTRAGGAAGDAAPGASIDFDLPAGWQSETPESPMRMAQAAIPGPGGPGQLAIFYFGPGAGGGVEDNLQRWIGQMAPAPGTEPERGTFETNGFRVTWVEVAGTLQPSTTGMGPATEQPGSKLLGAVVEGPGGPWFFKATGPEETLTDQRDAFLSMLRSVRAR